MVGNRATRAPLGAVQIDYFTYLRPTVGCSLNKIGKSRIIIQLNSIIRVIGVFHTDKQCLQNELLITGCKCKYIQVWTLLHMALRRSPFYLARLIDNRISFPLLTSPVSGLARKNGQVRRKSQATGPR